MSPERNGSGNNQRKAKKYAAAEAFRRQHENKGKLNRALDGKSTEVVVFSPKHRSGYRKK